MTYRVVVTPDAEAAIKSVARYLAEERHAPLAAARWLSRVHGVTASLEGWPFSGGTAPENDLVDYEVRMRLVGRHVLLYTVDESKKTVTVVGFRHAARMPRPGELPPDPAS